MVQPARGYHARSGIERSEKTVHEGMLGFLFLMVVEMQSLLGTRSGRLFVFDREEHSWPQLGRGSSSRYGTPRQPAPPSLVSNIEFFDFVKGQIITAPLVLCCANSPTQSEISQSWLETSSTGHRRGIQNNALLNVKTDRLGSAQWWVMNTAAKLSIISSRWASKLKSLLRSLKDGLRA